MDNQKSGKEKRKRPKTVNETALDQVAKETGLKFPVSQTSRALKKGKYSAKVGGTVPVYMAAVLEYVTGEVLELAGKIATDPSLNARVAGEESAPNTIMPAHIEYILQRDSELNQVVASISQHDTDGEREGGDSERDPADGEEETDDEDDEGEVTTLASGAVSSASSPTEPNEGEGTLARTLSAASDDT